MRSPWLLVALCVQAAISAAQTLPSSGTPPLEYRVDHVNTGPTPLQFSRAIGVSLSGLAANGALPGESGPTTLTFPSFFYSDQTTDDTVNASSSSRSDANDSQPAGKLSVKTSEPTQADTHVHWFAANRAALLTTAVWHIFNLWTEAGTRDALYGPWFRDWMRSVSELRGWSDSDEFMAPYASHPIGGSMFFASPKSC